MRRRGYRLTRYADDWLITCRSHGEARAALGGGQADTGEAGCDPEHRENPYCPCQTRVRVSRLQDQTGQAASQAASLEDHERGSRGNALCGSACKIHPALQEPDPPAYPAPRLLDSTQELIDQINPVVRGWGQYYCKAHVRKLFHQLDGWIVRRLWSHRHKRWRNAGWKRLPERKLIGEYGLVRLISLIPSLNLR